MTPRQIGRALDLLADISDEIRGLHRTALEVREEMREFRAEIAKTKENLK